MDYRKVVLNYIPIWRRGMGGLGRGGKIVELERPEGIYIKVDDENSHF
jgi:hypothetical protein